MLIATAKPRRTLQLILLDEIRRRRRRKHGGGPATVAAPTGPTNYASDTFDRANGALGTADSGQNWSLNSGAWVINTNQAAFTGGTVVRNATIDDGQTDGVWQCTIPVALSGGLVIRETAADTMLFLKPNGGLLKLFRVTAGILTTIGSGGAPGAGSVIKIAGAGDALDVWLDGTLIYSVVEAQGDTSTSHGIGAQSSTDRIDTWSHASA